MNSRWYRLSQIVFASRAAHQVMRRTKWVPRQGRHLDVGCGPLSWLWREGIAPVGIDTATDRAAAFGTAAVASAWALPFANHSFDVSWTFGLLHHLCDRDVQRTISELRRVTRPGGADVRRRTAGASFRASARIAHPLDGPRSMASGAGTSGGSIGPP